MTSDLRARVSALADEWERRRDSIADENWMPGVADQKRNQYDRCIAELRAPLAEPAAESVPPPAADGGEVEEPIEAGWYAYSGGAQTMIFHLRDTGQWSVHLDNGVASDCTWGYIEQALSVWDLVPIAPSSPVLHPPDTLRRLVDQWGAESIYDAFITRWPDADADLRRTERAEGAREAAEGAWDEAIVQASESGYLIVGYLALTQRNPYRRAASGAGQ